MRRANLQYQHSQKETKLASGGSFRMLKLDVDLTNDRRDGNKKQYTLEWFLSTGT